LCVGLWFCRGIFGRAAWRTWATVMDTARLFRFFAIGGDILVRSALLLAAMASFTFVGARFGDVTLAANEVLTQFIHITAFALDGFAFAVEALVAQRLGARDKAGLRRAAVIASGWAVALSIGLTVFFALWGPTLVDIMTTSEEVRREARVYLPWMVWVPMISVAAFMLDGIFIGATRTRDMRNMMAVSFAVYVLCVFALLPGFGNHGLWMALIIMYVVRAVTLGWLYPRIEASASP